MTDTKINGVDSSIAELLNAPSQMNADNAVTETDTTTDDTVIEDATETSAQPADGSQPAQPAKPEAPKEPADSESAKLLKELVQMQRDSLAASKPAAPAEPAKTAPVDPTYDFEIPERLITALRGEDPVQFQQGLSALAKGIGQAVHKQVVDHVLAQVKELIPSMDKLVPDVLTQVNAQQYASKVYTDFYTVNKDLDTPELRPIVVQAAQLLIKNKGEDKVVWNAAFMNEVSALVRMTTGKQAPATPVQKPAKAPSLASRGGARPSQPKVPEQEGHFAELLT